MDNTSAPSVVALGKFDGIHLGHQMIIKETVKISKGNNLKSIAYIIDISNQLMQKDEKEDMMNYFGIDKVIFEEFSDDFKNMMPDVFFVEILIKKLNAKHIVVGNDYRFGKDRLGNVSNLTKLCRENDINISVIEKLKIDNIVVSSTKIKEMLLCGDIINASKLLGRKYSITSSVKKGKSLGHKLGFPTVNFVNLKTILPPSGVYATQTFYDGKYYNSITNIGINPTVDNDNKIKAETFIFNFEKDVYGEEIKIEFLSRIRDEKKFNNIYELKNQIETDKKMVLKYFEKY